MLHLNVGATVRTRLKLFYFIVIIVIVSSIPNVFSYQKHDPKQENNLCKVTRFA